MNVKTWLAQHLKRYPTLYRLVAKIYFALKPYHLLELLIGTKAQEMRWATRSIAEGYWNNRNHPSKRFLVDRIVAFSPLSNILEVGCASGPNLYLLAKTFPHSKIIGIDINQAAVKYGNAQFAREGISNVKLFVGEADKLGQFSDKSFDIVFTKALLVCVGPDKIKKVTKDMVRITRKALLLVELHLFESNTKDPFGLGIYQGSWIRDYVALLKQFVSAEQIRVTKIPEDVWPAEPWKELGAVVEVVF